MYIKRITQKKFPTNNFCSRAFARDLRKTVAGRNLSQNEINFDAFMLALNEKSSQEEFFSKSTFEGWLNGNSIPYESTQKVIDEATDGLANKWFGREKFTNRFQLHLATLDLHYIDSKNSEYAYDEATSILHKIIDDWMPKNNRLEISGPKDRGGYDPELYALIKHSRLYSSESDGFFVEKSAMQAKVKYDLTLGPTSYVDTFIPKAIGNIYQKGNPLSIVPYMFCLLCLGSDDESNYKQDLFLDFLSALNCAHFIVFKYSGGMLFKENDHVGTSILGLFFQATEYYYDDFWSYKNQLKQRAKRKPPSKEVKGDPTFNCGFMNHPAGILADTLETIINRELSRTSAEFTNEDGLENLLIGIPKLLMELREFYMDLYAISGLTEEEIMNSVLKKFWVYPAEDGSHITEYSTIKTRNKSPYK